MKTIKFLLIAIVNVLLPKVHQNEFNAIYVDNNRLFLTCQHSIKYTKFLKYWDVYLVCWAIALIGYFVLDGLLLLIDKI